jgi:nitrite reductase/ring-hydroxylating ferredoxin subunit
MSVPALKSESIRLCAVGDLPAGSARGFDVGRHRISLIRIGDDYWLYASE